MIQWIYANADNTYGGKENETLFWSFTGCDFDLDLFCVLYRPDCNRRTHAYTGTDCNRSTHAYTRTVYTP